MSTRVNRKEYARIRSDEKHEKHEGPANEIRVVASRGQKMYISYAIDLFTGAENKPKHDTITLQGMGAAVYNAVNIAEIVKRRVKGLHQTTDISSMTVKDEYEARDDSKKHVEIERKVSTIIITLSTKPLDVKHVGYQAPLPESEVTEQDESKLGERREGGRGRGRGRGRGGRGGDRDARPVSTRGGRGGDRAYDDRAPRGGRGGDRAYDDRAPRGGRGGPRDDRAPRGGRGGRDERRDDRAPRGGDRRDERRDRDDRAPRGGRGGARDERRDDRAPRGGDRRDERRDRDDRAPRGGRGGARDERRDDRAPRGGRGGYASHN